MSRKAILVTFLLMLVSCLGFAQEMVSAEKFFASLSASFGKVKDYEAAITITQGKSVSRGKISYKSPLYLRIDFDDPPRAGAQLRRGEAHVLSPRRTRWSWSRSTRRRTPARLKVLPAAQGLTLLQRNYSVAYLTGPAPVPLEDGSREMVVKLKLTAHGTTGFSQMIISVKDSLIRRVEGTQSSGDKIVMDYREHPHQPGRARFAVQVRPPGLRERHPGLALRSGRVGLWNRSVRNFDWPASATT